MYHSGHHYPILNIRADLLLLASKNVEVSAYLPQRQRRNARRRERRLWLKTAPREETFSMLCAGNGDYAPDAIIYYMLIDEPAIYMLGRYEQKGCWV